MGWPIVIVAEGGLPVSEAANGVGVPVTVAENGYGTAVTLATTGGMAVVGTGEEPGGGDPYAPVTLYEPSLPLSSTDTGNANFTFRVEMPALVDMRDEVRVIIQPGASADMTIIGMGFGKNVPGTYGNTVDPVLELKFGGGSGFATATTPKASDWTNVTGLTPVLAGDTIVVTFTLGGSGHSSTAHSASHAAPVVTNFQSGAFWNTQNVNGLGFTNLDGTIYGIILVETRTPEAPTVIPPGPPITIFSAPVTPTGSDSNPNYTFRLELPLTGPVLDEVRVTIKPGDMLTLIGMGFGENVAGTYADTVDPIVELKFGGFSGFEDKTTEQVSDWTGVSALDITASDLAVVTYATGTSGHASTAYSTGNGAPIVSNHQSGNHWALQSVAGLGFSDSAGSIWGITKIETRTAGSTTGGGGGVTGAIPMTWDDPMFTGMTELTSPLDTVGVGESIDHLSIDEHSGDSTIETTSGNTVSYCRVFSRECVRINGSADFDHCYFDALGIVTTPPDHADTVQHYSMGTRGALVTWTNCHLIGHLVEATACYFVADDWGGTIKFENVIFNSGPFGVKMAADPGCDLVLYFKDCYFVPPWSNNDGANYPHVFLAVGTGTITFAQWENVRYATIVDGVLIPGAAMAQPSVDT